MYNTIYREKGIAKVWTKPEEIEQSALEQIEHCLDLPFLFKHLAIMPDIHTGYGVTIGSVLCTENVILPNAVGVDIGCGVCTTKTNVKTQIFNQTTIKNIMKKIRDKIPLGFNHHKEKQDKKLMPINEQITSPSNIWNSVIKQEYNNALTQIGTLGGGNHFIEFQKDKNNNIWIMIHSGSRNLGYTVAKHYSDLAFDLNTKWYSNTYLKKKNDALAFLPIDSQNGQDYLIEMNYCVDFALTNRKLMMDRILEIFDFIFEEFDNDKIINIAHNYAKFESHCATCIDNQDNDNPIVESLLGAGGVSKVQDFLTGYRPVIHSCGGLILSGATSFLKISPSQVDALEQMIGVWHSLNLGPELKHNHLRTSLHLCGCEGPVPFDESYYNFLNKFGLGFSHLFGVEKDYYKWDRILGRIFLGFLAYNLDCKLHNKDISSIPQKHNITQVMVHRKGATLARKDTIGIIPGSQGTKSYIVKGRGNKDSYESCSHGAGRIMGRKQAEKTLNLEEEIKKLDDQNIIHSIRTTKDLDEATGAYKNIEEVMKNQEDLVEVIEKLTPLAVIKG